MQNPNVGKTLVFDGAGTILNSTLRRTSKNRYEIFIIREADIERSVHYGFGAVIEALQKAYDTSGSLLPFIQNAGA